METRIPSPEFDECASPTVVPSMNLRPVLDPHTPSLVPFLGLHSSALPSESVNSNKSTPSDQYSSILTTQYSPSNRISCQCEAPSGSEQTACGQSEEHSPASGEEIEEGEERGMAAMKGSGPASSSTTSARAALGRRIVWAYGTGHMLNDLTAACWFTYLLIFLNDIGLSPWQAGSVMMSGQLADAVATLLAGRLIDSFGFFKRWHFGGTLLTTLSFSSVFGGCLICTLLSSSSTALQTLSYAFFAAIFNCGWAATQVSHMSLVNCLTRNPSSRVALNSCRNAFTMVANLLLYGIAFVAFLALPCSSPSQVRAQFRWIAFVSVVVGLLFLLIFYAGVKEPLLSHIRSKSSVQHSLSACESSTVPSVDWKFWFGQLSYYQVAIVYTSTRLVTNVSQAMLPFFLVNDLNMHPSSKAVVPAIVFIASFVASVTFQEMQWKSIHLKLVFSLGSFLWILSSAAFFFIDSSVPSAIYILAIVIGVANAFLLVTATSMEGELVGQKLSGCAFVYGSLSFLDKLTCGLTLFLISSINSQGTFCGRLSASCHRSMVRWVLVLLPLVCCSLATLVAVNTDLEDHEHEPVIQVISASALSEPLLLDSSTQHGSGGYGAPGRDGSFESRSVLVRDVEDQSSGCIDVMARRRGRPSLTINEAEP